MANLTPEVPNFSITKRVLLQDGTHQFVEMTKEQLFDDKSVVIFGLPGAFTPTCSTQQLPGFEDLYYDFRDSGIDDIYCITVNDTFVCNEWALNQGLVNVKVIPDGSAEFTIKMGMDVRKDNLGFGIRSWRYAAIVDNGVVVQDFIEDGFADNVEGDPYEVSTPENVLDNVKAYGWTAVSKEGKHIDLEFSDSTDVKENFS